MNYGTVLGNPDKSIKDTQQSDNISTKNKKKRKRKTKNKVPETYEIIVPENSLDKDQEGIENYHYGGYHPVKIGEIYKRRYKILKKLGWGQFSTVWFARDLKLNKNVALKIVKSGESYTDAALDEIEILNKIAEQKSTTVFDINNDKIINLLNDFYCKGPNGKHICLVFELLGRNLYNELKRTNRKGFSIPIVKNIIRQLLEGINFLHEKCKIIHTDLKPENMMSITNEDIHENSLIKIIDLGNACWTYKHFSDGIQTRHYRAPESIIYCRYDTSSDMWSVACILMELLTTDLIFNPVKGENFDRNDDHLATIMELTGKKFPKWLIERSYSGREYFNRKGDLKYIKGIHIWKLKDQLHSKYRFTTEEADEIYDFIEPMFRIDPNKRATAKQMLEHKWLSNH